MADNGGNASQFLAPPAVTAIKAEARESDTRRVQMERSLSNDIRAEREDLREAAEQTLNVILDLGLDGRIKWVSPSWKQVVGSSPEEVEGQPISDLLISSNKNVFHDAVQSMREDDSRSRFIRFSLRMGPESVLKFAPEQRVIVEEPEGENEPTSGDGDGTPDNPEKSEKKFTDVLDMEAQGIMVYDRSAGDESHTMWMLRPSSTPREVTIDLPPLLVESLGVGAEVLANHLTMLAEAGGKESGEAKVASPTPVLCRICERHITPWWFEKHSELCLQEHRAEMDVQLAQENLNEQRHAIVKVLDALEARQGRPHPADSTSGVLSQPEYKGFSIGPSPASSGPTSAPSLSPATPPRSRDVSASGHGHVRGRSFAVRRPLARIVELILDLCDTALEISTPALKENRGEAGDEFRTLSPQSESRISQVLQWQSPSSNTLDQEQGLALLSTDTEQVAKAKVDAVIRHRGIVEYAERIRIEYTAMVEECIEAALTKAERIAAGELSDSSSSYEEDEQQEVEDDGDEEGEGAGQGAQTPAVLTTSGTIEKSEPLPSSSQSTTALPVDHSLEDQPRAFSDPSSVASQSPRRGSSIAVSTRSASPMECPTPRSHKSAVGVLALSQSSKRGSLLTESDAGDNSDASLPSSSTTGMISGGLRTDSPLSDRGPSRSASSRDRKRKSLILTGIPSNSPRRQQSPGRIPGPQSPLRLTKPRLPSGESMPSPHISPLLTTNELAVHGLPQHHHLHHFPHHRRQSSATSADFVKPPISPRLTSTSQPQPRPAPLSIRDFEIIKPISKGAFGSVYLSKKKATGEYFAIKVLKKADMVAKNQVTNVKAERAIMMWQGESDFVAKLYWTFSSKEYLYLVMEYLNGGDCASLVKVLGGLPEDWAKKYIAEVVLGVEHLHNRGIVHRDLKPDNLLIDQKGHLKLTDFGLSRMGLVGRQKRVLKNPNESAPDLLKQGGPFPRTISLASSRSASFDFQGGQSPCSTPVMTPEAAGSYSQPSYFSLNQTSLSRENSRRASGYRSDSGGSDTLNAIFRTFSLHDNAEPSAATSSLPQSGMTADEEAASEGDDSPHLIPLQTTISHTSVPHSTPPQSSMLPPAMALFDPEDHNRRFVGTPDYLAPETIHGSGQDETSDWWSLGCIMFEFLYGYPPFNASTPDEVFQNILNRKINWPEDADELVSPEAKDLMERLMTIDPEKRLGSNAEGKYPSGGAEIQAHPWFADINWETLLEDKAQFVPNLDNPEDTEYFDARGATLQSFNEEIEDQVSPQYPLTAGEYPDRPHDALSKVRSQVNSIKRGLMPLHIPPHVRDSRNRRLSEPAAADDFGNFNFKNLPMLEKANKDVIQKLRQEAMKAQQRAITSGTATPQSSTAPSLEGSPLLPMPLQRTLSHSKGTNRPQSPSGLSQANSSPSRPSQPSSPLLVQFSTGQNPERRKTSGSSSTQSQQSAPAAVTTEKLADVPRLTTSIKLGSSAPSPNKPPRVPATSPEKTTSGHRRSSISARARSQTVGSPEADPPSREFLPSHHKRRSQLFDVSPSSSDNEDPRAKALLKVQRRRQSSKRLSQINLMDGPFFRPLDVLICEDHPVSRLVMERLFEKLRCRTITAVNGSEAIRYALSDIQFDIILTEFKLPRINGADIARMVRETRSANKQTPIIAVTGYLKDLPETHHFDSLIEKPPTITKLTETLCKFCNWKPPPRDWTPTQTLSIPSAPLQQARLQTEDSPSSTSSGYPQITSSSYRGSSRTDSMGSSYFGDMDSIKAEDGPVIVSRHTDEWGTSSGGLGISEDASSPPAKEVQSGSGPGPTKIPQLQQSLSAPAPVPSGLVTPRKQRSTEAIRAKRESMEKRRYEAAESGDDEDEELGNLQTRTRSPHAGRGPRSSSKLGTEMMRTNSRGSVVSGTEEILKKEQETMEQEGPQTVEGKPSIGIEERLGQLRINDKLSTSPRVIEEEPLSPGSPEPETSLPKRPSSLAPLHEYETEIRIPSEPKQTEAPVDSSSSKIRASKADHLIALEGSAIESDSSHSSSGRTLVDPTTPGATTTVIDNDTTPRPTSRGQPHQPLKIDTDVTPRPPKNQSDSPRAKEHRSLFHWKRH